MWMMAQVRSLSCSMKEGKSICENFIDLFPKQNYWFFSKFRCSVDQFLLDNLDYAPNGLFAQKESYAFKFSDRVKFQPSYFFVMKFVAGCEFRVQHSNRFEGKWTMPGIFFLFQKFSMFQSFSRTLARVVLDEELEADCLERLKFEFT